VSQQQLSRLDPSAGKNYLPSLTGLRFVAASAVFACHAMLSLPGGTARNGLSHVLPQGAVGVSFFFVLSGFILTWTHRPDDSPARFYRRRAARVLPAYWVALAIAVVVNASFGWGQGVAKILPSVVALQAFFPDDQVHFGGNTVGWSLSAEVFFYATFPVLLLAMRRRAGRLLLVTVALLAVFVVPAALPGSGETSLGYWAIYVLPLQRLAEFVLGIALAQAMRSGRRMPVSVPAALAIALGAYLLVDVAPVSFGYVAVTAVPLLTLVGAAAQRDIDKAPSFLRHPVLMRLGDWSYAFYLVHLTVIRTVIELADRAGIPVTHSAIAAVVTLAASLPLSIGAAAALHHLVEAPLERRLRGTSRSRTQPIPDRR
jgi:peptidoglycan/LPS O-acetylase OafA/YrhL